MLPFLRKNDPHALAVAMTSVKMGDQLAEIGCADSGRLGAIAARVGLSGRAVAVVPDDAAATRAQRGAAEAGALVEIQFPIAVAASFIYPSLISCNCHYRS